MVEQFPAVFVPDDGRPGFSLGNAKKDNLVAQDVLVVEVRGLGNLSSLTRNHLIIYRQIDILIDKIKRYRETSIKKTIHIVHKTAEI